MNLKIFTSVLLCAPLIVHADAYQSLLRRYEKQIQKQNRQLQQLRVRLQENDRDAARWQRKAESAKDQWTATTSQADRVRQLADDTKSQWVRKRQMAEVMEWETTTQTLLAQSAEREIAHASRELLTKQLLSRPADVRPEDRMPEYITENLGVVAGEAVNLSQKAQQEQVRLRIEELKLKSAEQERREQWSRLRQEQQSHWMKWQEALRKRAALLEEKSQMEQSEAALSVMLRNLRDDKNRAAVARRGEVELNDKKLAALKSTLPWPAYGKIVQGFGRTQSAELNQLVISNGIKIETGPSKAIRNIAAGKVIYAASFRSYGQLVIIQHPTGLTSVYGGLGEISVKEGDALSVLDSVGRTGDSGSFYFELRRDERPVNPIVYLVPMRSQEITSRRIFQ